ncbi:MAG TPA: hypothetical protein VNQ90_21325 [Chthoniobacteraceae bacterium]|nr:hypothetical protein [Chthoniobacteraceae bacterium]
MQGVIPGEPANATMEVLADRDHLDIRSRMADPADPGAELLEAFVRDGK